MPRRERLSATVEADALAAAREAVAEGRAESLSSWVNAALVREAAQDRRLRAVERFFREYETKHGEITAAEIDAATRRTRARAVVVRGGKQRSRRKRGGAA